MGRHHEVRAAAMAKTAATKGALYMRASKEAYMAAKTGSPDPKTNLALRAVFDKYRGQSVPRDVFDRAIKKAQGGSGETYIAGRYGAFGPGSSLLIVDTLSDNANRALVDIKTLIVKKGGHMGPVEYNFTETGIFAFKGNDRDKVEETLILGDVDVREVTIDDGVIEALVEPRDFAKAKELLESMGVAEFDMAQLTMLANETITLEDEHKERFQELLDSLDELEDVQAVYHNVNL